MPPRNPNRDLFEHKWERIATAWGNMDVLAQSDPRAMESILRRTASEFSTARATIRPTFIAASSFGTLTADLCARAAANNLNKLVIEQHELARLPQAEQQVVRAKLSALAIKCRGFQLALPISADRRDRLVRAMVKFRDTY